MQRLRDVVTRNDLPSLVLSAVLVLIAVAILWTAEALIPTQRHWRVTTYGKGPEVIPFAYIVLAWAYFTLRPILVRAFPSMRWTTDLLILSVLLVAALGIYAVARVA